MSEEIGRGRVMNLEQVMQFRLLIPEPFDFERTVVKQAGWH